MKPGELDESTLRALFETKIKDELDGQIKPGSMTGRERPVIIFTGGQPGAGKSNANARAKYDRPNLVEIVGDDFRAHHPDYQRIMRDDPLTMPDHTAQASGRWVGMSADYTRSQRMDTLLETTLRQPDVVARTMGDFKKAGYEVELHVVAVPAEISRIGTVNRYAGQVRDQGAGRWTPSAAHDVAAAAVPGTMKTLLDSGLVDRLLLVSRSGDELYSRDRRIGQKIDSGEAVSALNLARDVSKTEPVAAVQELGNAERGIATCASTGQTDRDLLSTISRFTATDAPALAMAAYPGSDAEQKKALGKIQAAAEPLGSQKTKQGLNDRIRQRVEAIKKQPGEVRSNAPRLDKGGPKR